MFGTGSRPMYQPERREAAREEVHHRARGTTPEGTTLALEIVNISASGFMARTDAPLREGETFLLTLPAVGEQRATIRWALGGRIGCEFARRIELVPYLELLGRLMKG